MSCKKDNEIREAIIYKSQQLQWRYCFIKTFDVY